MSYICGASGNAKKGAPTRTTLVKRKVRYLYDHRESMGEEIVQEIDTSLVESTNIKEEDVRWLEEEKVVDLRTTGNKKPNRGRNAPRDKYDGMRTEWDELQKLRTS
jgi:hypothetical protein